MTYKDDMDFKHQVYFASTHGLLKVLQKLFDDTNKTRRCVRTALNVGLRLATINDHAAVMQVLLAFKASIVNASLEPDAPPCSLLRRAAKHCKTKESIRLLIDAKCDVAERRSDTLCETALCVAAQSNNVTAVQTLLDYKASVFSYTGPSPINLTTSTKVVKLLAGAKANVDKHHERTSSPLVQAVRLQRADLVSTLLEAKADIVLFEKHKTWTTTYVQPSDVSVTKLLDDAARKAAPRFEAQRQQEKRHKAKWEEFITRLEAQGHDHESSDHESSDFEIVD